MPTVIVVVLSLWMLIRSAAAQPAETALVLMGTISAVVVLTLLRSPRQS